ncbi:MAG: branched-chain amino acid ABC transporter permease, partial [Desulfofustis sp.]|nr:branched-chain amino acid ABC transporter permease [Desulfofustis sp.]
MDIFLQNIINALQWGSFYAVVSIGYSMVYGVLMLFNFAHGDIFMVGTYIGFGIATLLLALFSAFMPGWMIFILVILITMFLASFVGVFVEMVGYRPLRGAPRASAAITGLMIGIIFETGNLIILGAQRFSFPPLIESVTYNIGGIYVTNVKVLIIVASLVMMFALHLFIKKTKWGMAMRAMSYDFQAVPLMGVSINVIA